MAIKVVSIAEMQAIEAAADAAGHSYAQMMQRAGQAAADFILEDFHGYGALILVGPGNNGGDGLVVARHLMNQDRDVTVVCYLLKHRDDQVYQDAVAAGVTMIVAADDPVFAQLRQELQTCDVVIDALFGIGVELPLRELVQALLKVVHEQRKPDPRRYREWGRQNPRWRNLDVVAIDCPSGMNCDTGEVDEWALKADWTITFGAVKTGMLSLPAFDYLGELLVGDIGLPSPLPALDDIQLEMATADDRLPERPNDGHKGTFGKALLVAGSSEFIGAAYLAAAAAYRVGAGLVTAGAPDSLIPVLAGMLPEATWFPLPRVITEVDSLVEKAQGYTSLLIGPGLGQGNNTQQFLASFLETDVETNLPPMILDADALNLLAKMDKWSQKLRPNTILTPHPAEFSRLTGLSTDEVQANRLEHARSFAQKWNSVVVLKGAFTVIAAPDGKAWISPYANSILATAGTGDVLAGCIVGFLAQGCNPVDAAVAGVCVHGYAAKDYRYATGMLASDLLNLLPRVLDRLTQ